MKMVKISSDIIAELNKIKLKTVLILITISLISYSQLAFGQAEPTPAEIAAKMANPTTVPAQMVNNFDFKQYQGSLAGASDQTGFSYLLQPVFPLSSKSTRFTLRPAIPVLFSQPVYDADNSEWNSKFALGDIGFDLVYGTTFKSGFILQGGLVGSMPTATGGLGSGQWQLGPNVLFGVAKKWGVVAALVNHKWNVYGPGANTSVTAGSVFVVIPVGDGSWQITSLPIISYNHNLEGEKWTLPVTLGFGKTTILGGGIFRLLAEASYYVLSPDVFGPKSQIRFTVAKVINNPFTK